MLISFFCCVISSIPVFVKFSTIVTCFALIAILIDFVSSSSSSSSVSIPFSCCVISSIFVKFSTIVTCFSMIAILVASVLISFSSCIISSIFVLFSSSLVANT
jgi:hypothetical protein